MSIVIREIKDSSGLKDFIRFPNRLYKSEPCFVPPLLYDEASTLNPKKNPAFDYCEARYWLAYKDGKIAGRIAGIINKAYIEKWKKKHIRFGWFDFEDDAEIANLLIEKVEDWGRSLGMEAVHGPLGFTDLDFEGMLVDGFEERGTIAALYNYEYYPRHLEKAGYTKHTDWLEYRIKVPEVMDEHLEKLAAIVKRRNKLEVVEVKRTKDILPYAPGIFSLINSAYAELYGVVPLTEKQVEYYTKKYFSFIRPDFVTLLIKDQKLAAFSITMPSLSIALQRSKGKIFPFGFYHLLMAMRKNNTADLLLIAVQKELQGKGVNAVLMYETLRSYIRNGIRFADASHQLEDNTKVRSLWDGFDATAHKRRRCYIKYLNNE
jgi:GNAT superfamily N-acetyltransferase